MVFIWKSNSIITPYENKDITIEVQQYNYIVGQQSFHVEFNNIITL